MTVEKISKREALIKRHKEKFAKFSLEERQKAAERVEKYFENTHGDKRTKKKQQ